MSTIGHNAEFEFPDEPARIRLVFALMAIAVLAIAVRLFYLQVGHHSNAVARARGMAEKVEDLPSSRCRIFDRDGRLLAYDRPIHAVQAEVYFRLDDARRFVPDFEKHRDAMIGRILRAIRRDPSVGDADSSTDWRRRLERRLDKGHAHSMKALAARRAAWEAERRRAGKAGRFPEKRLKVDFLVHSELADAGAILALEQLDLRRDRTGATRRYQLYLHFQRKFERVYEDPTATAGIVGVVSDVFTSGGVRRIGSTGLERLRIAREGSSGSREFRVDARMVPYWTARGDAPETPLAMRTTIDLDLQRAARAHLRDKAVQDVVDHYGSPPDWAGIMAVEVATGDVLAMASFTQARQPNGSPEVEIQNDPNGAFAPTTCVFEPGSVVKPLVLALAHERGKIDWAKPVDCRRVDLPVGSGQYRRPIRDVHACGMLDAGEVLIRSSNVGAVRLGMRLGAVGLDEYLDRFGFRSSHGLPLPERSRIVPESIQAMSWNDQNIWVGPSLCFGYAAQMTIAHLARSYLTLLSGRERALRLVDALAFDGDYRRLPSPDRDSQPFLSNGSIYRVKQAMRDMVAGADHATASSLTSMLDGLGVPRGVVAGKTGTAQFGPRDQMTRTASFVGFAPADDPRVLVVCVVQKFDAALFYGGQYAAPAAGRLLLDALGYSVESGTAGARTVGASQVSAFASGLHAVRGR